MPAPFVCPGLRSAVLHGNCRDHPAGAVPRSTIREELFRSAQRARSAPENARLRNACGGELPPVRLGQVDDGLAVQVAPLREPRHKLRRDFRSDGIAPAADSRPDGGEEVLRPRSETVAHRLDSFRRDSRDGAAPPGVNGRNRLQTLVDEQDRDTVGGADGEIRSDTVRDERIGLAKAPRAAVDDHGDIGMDLLDPGVRAGRPVSGIAGPETVIEPREAIEFADPVPLLWIFIEHPVAEWNGTMPAVGSGRS